MISYEAVETSNKAITQQTSNHESVYMHACIYVHILQTLKRGGLDHLLPKFEHIFVAVITFFPFLLCRYFYYQLVAYCVCFKMICEMSL